MRFTTIASVLALAASVASQNTTAQTDCGHVQAGRSPFVQCEIDPKDPIPSAPCSCDPAKLAIVNPFLACLNDMFAKKPDATISDYDRMLIGIPDMCAGIRAQNNGSIPASTGTRNTTSPSGTNSNSTNSSTTTTRSSPTASPTAATAGSGAAEAMKFTMGGVAVVLASVMASLF
ncbi:hypothetical protein HK097_006433 [Rhizophlyctis rosea]|uniref:Uncharacterized protein n=1 Tax=Rhizophlyctis rosea TaxID=64517 RepID=A0AAD5X2U1_9FUNG|nr:hypothetical protein HK097_006433 [Rhizophlyctis rosea]